MNSYLDPWEAWLGIPLAEQPPDHYRLLGLPRFLPDAPTIDRALASRRTLLMAHVTGPHGDEARRMLEECETAASCLMDARSRMTYDAALRRELGLDEGPLNLPADAIVSGSPAFSFSTPTDAASGATAVDANQSPAAGFSFASNQAVSWSFGAAPAEPAPAEPVAPAPAEPEAVMQVVPVEQEVSQVIPVDEPAEQAPAEKPIVTGAVNVSPAAPVERPNEALVALWEGAKIVLGGVAGLGAGYLILAFFFPNHSFFGGNGESPDKAPAKPAEVVKNETPPDRPTPIPKPEKITRVPQTPESATPETPKEEKVTPSVEEESPFRLVDPDPIEREPANPGIATTDPRSRIIPPSIDLNVGGKKSDVVISSPKIGEPRLPFRDPKSAPPEVEVATPSPQPAVVSPMKPAPMIEPTPSGPVGPVELPQPIGTAAKSLVTRSAPPSTDTKLELFSVGALGEGKTFAMSAAANSQPPAWRVVSPKKAGPDASETAVIAQFLLDGRELQLQWAKQASEMPFRQLKNSLLKIRSGGATETIPLRLALKAKPIVLGFKEKAQSEELQIGDLPRTDAIHFVAEDLTGWPKGTRFKGGSRFAKIGQPLTIEMEDFPEIEIAIRLTRRDDDTLGIAVVPTYEDSPSTKLDFTAQRMNNLKSATEQGLAGALQEMPQLQRDAKVLQAKLVDANLMPAKNGIEINQKRQAIEKLSSLIQVAARRYASLEKRVPILQKRLESMPKLEIIMNSLAGEATIRYRIVAAMESDELVLVDARQ